MDVSSCTRCHPAGFGHNFPLCEGNTEAFPGSDGSGQEDFGDVQGSTIEMATEGDPVLVPHRGKLDRFGQQSASWHVPQDRDVLDLNP